MRCTMRVLYCPAAQVELARVVRGGGALEWLFPGRRGDALACLSPTYFAYVSRD
jgi:hypothetical protein